MRYSATPLASDEGDQLSAIALGDCAVATRSCGTLGALKSNSGGASVVAVAGVESAEVFGCAALSVARTVYVCVLLGSSAASVKLVVCTVAIGSGAPSR